MSDVVDDLKAAVRTARRARAAADKRHEHVKELLLQVRKERPDLGLADIEEMIDRYFDRATISRLTYPQLGEGHGRKRGRRPTGS